MTNVIRNTCIIFILVFSASHCKLLIPDSKELEVECKDNKASACTQIGVRKAFGTWGYTKDYKSAIIFLQKGCTGGDAQGCKEMGVMHEHGRGTVRNLTLAADYYSTACKKKIASACDYLGDMYKSGRGVPKNEQASKDYYKQACAAGYKSDCNK